MKMKLLAILLFILVCVTAYYVSSQYTDYTKAKRYKESHTLGDKVVVHLPDHTTMYTYSNYIVESKGKTYYKNDLDKIDITGSDVEYKEWK